MTDFLVNEGLDYELWHRAFGVELIRKADGAGVFVQGEDAIHLESEAPADPLAFDQWAEQYDHVLEENS
jgi:hypothetical protein